MMLRDQQAGFNDASPFISLKHKVIEVTVGREVGSAEGGQDTTSRLREGTA